MAWFGLRDTDGASFDPNGLGGGTADRRPQDCDALLARGTILIETVFPVLTRPRILLRSQTSGPRPVGLTLQALPGGALTLIVDLGGDIHHHNFDCAEYAPTDILRISYGWDGPARVGRLALECGDQDRIDLSPLQDPRPMPLAALHALITEPEHTYVAPEIGYVAVSDALEPVGPGPSLGIHAPVATPAGYRAIGELRRGDLVLAASGGYVPVLHALRRTVPARGSFAPLRLRAPYFGLRQDIVAAPSQKLRLRGSEVEYMFGRETVLARAGHIAGSTAVRPEPANALITYAQILLPDQEPLDVAGAELESLFVGRLRRKPQMLAASMFGECARASLPEHAAPRHPVLRAFDALVLAEYRAA